MYNNNYHYPHYTYKSIHYHTHEATVIYVHNIMLPTIFVGRFLVDLLLLFSNYSTMHMHIIIE